MNWNLVQIGGRLTRDVQLRFTPNQMAVCDFGVATNRTFKSGDGEKREEVAFVDVTAFGSQAETINKFFRKGMPIFLKALRLVASILNNIISLIALPFKTCTLRFI